MRALALSALVLLSAGSARAASPAGATLAYASGPVTVRDKTGSHRGAKGERLATGDEVWTGKDGAAVIALADGSRLKLTESSRLTLTLPTAASPSAEFRLSLGGVFAKVAKQALGASFRVRTETAVAAVRGTRFFTAYGRKRAGKRDLWVCVDEGLVDVGTDASPRPLGVPAGKGVLVKSGLDLTSPQAYDWTKKLNWNMDPAAGEVRDRTNLDSAYTDLLDQDYR